MLSEDLSDPMLARLSLRGASLEELDHSIQRMCRIGIRRASSEGRFGTRQQDTETPHHCCTLTNIALGLGRRKRAPTPILRDTCWGKPEPCPLQLLFCLAGSTRSGFVGMPLEGLEKSLFRELVRMRRQLGGPAGQQYNCPRRFAGLRRLECLGESWRPR